MKKLIVLFILMITTQVNSQVSLITLVGSGIEIDNNLNLTLYQANINIEPRAEIGKFSFSVLSQTKLTDSVSKWLVGFQPEYKIYQIDSNNIFRLGAVILLGESGEQNYGLETSYQMNSVLYRLSFTREFKTNVNSLMFGIGYNILK